MSEYSIAKKPFGPILTGEDNYDEFTQNAEDFLRSQGLWEVASGAKTLSLTATAKEAKEWNKENSEAIGYYRGNVADVLKPKLAGQTTCAGMIATLASLFAVRSSEQAHVVLSTLLRSVYFEGDNFEEWLQEFEHKANRLARMKAPVDDAQLLLILKADRKSVV